MLPEAGGEAGRFTTACPAELTASAVVFREPMACSGLLSCAVLLALGDAWGGAGKEGAPDTGLLVEGHAGGDDILRCGPAGTKDGAVTCSRSGALYCEAAHGLGEVSGAAGSAGDSACAAGLKGCNEECNRSFGCRAAPMLGDRARADGAVSAAACPAGIKGCAVGCSGGPHCEAVCGPREGATACAAGKVGDSACAAASEGCNEEHNRWCGRKAELVLGGRACDDWAVSAAACPAGQKGCAVGRSPVAWRLTPPEGIGTVLAAGRATALDLKGWEVARPRFGLPRKISCACGLRPDMDLLLCCSVLPSDALSTKGSLSNRILLLDRLSVRPAALTCTSWASKAGGGFCSGMIAQERLAAGTAMLTWPPRAPMLGGHIHVG